MRRLWILWWYSVLYLEGLFLHFFIFIATQRMHTDWIAAIAENVRLSLYRRWVFGIIFLVPFHLIHQHQRLIPIWASETEMGWWGWEETSKMGLHCSWPDDYQIEPSWNSYNIRSKCTQLHKVLGETPLPDSACGLVRLLPPPLISTTLWYDTITLAASKTLYGKGAPLAVGIGKHGNWITKLY